MKWKFLAVSTLSMMLFASVGVVAFGHHIPPAIPAPNFTLTDIDGSTFSLADYRGKVVLLNFFFTR